MLHYGYINKWWKGKWHLKKHFPEYIREEIYKNIPFEHDEMYVYNGAGFDNKNNTPWTNKEPIRRTAVLYAPHLRREILPWELVIDIDGDPNNPERFIKRARLIQATLEKLEIPYKVAFSGNRGFHFHIMLSGDSVPPKEATWILAKGMKFLKKAILYKIEEYAGFDMIDEDSSGAGTACKHMIQEFYSIHYKTQCYVLPIEGEVKVEKIKFPNEPPNRSVYIEPWKISNEQWEWIIESAKKIVSKELSVDFKKYFGIVGFGRRRVKPPITTKNKIHTGDEKDWKVKRIKYYSEVLKKYGRLEADEKIRRRHENEHMARVHLVLLCIECGYTDEQIHEIFKYAEDYNPKKTQYFIDYNRKWIIRKRRTSQT